MLWVDNLANNKYSYNTNKSAFLRLMRKTAEIVLEEKNVIPQLAWSNLCKLSFVKGNPSNKLKVAQKEYCKRILEEEIRLLSPKYVVMLTSGWEYVYLKYLDGGTPPTQIAEYTWDKNHKAQKFMIGNVTYITSQHP